MDRREFIRSSLALAGLTLANPVLSLGSGVKEKVKVFVATGKAAEAVPALLAKIGGLRQVIKKGDLVLVKPNFSFSNRPEEATTTDPNVVKAVVLECKEAGAKRVTVADHTIRNAKTCLERSGVQDALKDIKDVKIVVPHKKTHFKEVKVDGGKSLKKVRIAEVYLDSDVYINLPVAKNHSASIVSFGLKNQMGLILDRWAFHSKYDLHQAIADLATVMKPHLTILDATRCLRTAGPSGPGEVVELGRIMCSTDPVALDAYATTLIEWGGKSLNPGDIPHIKYAAAHGLGEMNLTNIQIL